MPGKLSILLLTEDTGDDAHAVLRAVVEKLLFSIEPAVDASRIEYERADERARQAMGFNLYKSTKSRDYGKQLDLAGAIATKLLRTDAETFVFVHVDGDRRWSERGSTDAELCDNQALFTRNVMRRVHNLLATKSAADRLQRVLMVLPFWCIESWLYQNSRELQRLCRHHAPRHDRDQAMLLAWSGDPASLDETEQPKLKVPTIKDRWNLDLARSLPARKLLHLGLSFAFTVDRAHACDPLLAALSGISRSA